MSLFSKFQLNAHKTQAAFQSPIADLFLHCPVAEQEKGSQLGTHSLLIFIYVSSILSIYTLLLSTLYGKKIYILLWLARDRAVAHAATTR